MLWRNDQISTTVYILYVLAHGDQNDSWFLCVSGGRLCDQQPPDAGPDGVPRPARPGGAGARGPALHALTARSRSRSQTWEQRSSNPRPHCRARESGKWRLAYTRWRPQSRLLRIMAMFHFAWSSTWNLRRDNWDLLYTGLKSPSWGHCQFVKPLVRVYGCKIVVRQPSSEVQDNHQGQRGQPLVFVKVAFETRLLTCGLRGKRGQASSHWAMCKREGRKTFNMNLVLHNHTAVLYATNFATLHHPIHVLISKCILFVYFQNIFS